MELHGNNHARRFGNDVAMSKVAGGVRALRGSDRLERLTVRGLFNGDRSHVRRDDPLVVGVKLHAQPNADPPELQATATETRPGQMSSRFCREKHTALNQDLSRVRPQDGDVVDGVFGLHHQGREGVYIIEPNAMRQRHFLDKAIQRTPPWHDDGIGSIVQQLAGLVSGAQTGVCSNRRITRNGLRHRFHV